VKAILDPFHLIAFVGGSGNFPISSSFLRWMDPFGLFAAMPAKVDLFGRTDTSCSAATSAIPLTMWWSGTSSASGALSSQGSIDENVCYQVQVTTGDYTVGGVGYTDVSLNAGTGLSDAQLVALGGSAGNSPITNPNQNALGFDDGTKTAFAIKCSCVSSTVYTYYTDRRRRYYWTYPYPTTSKAYCEVYSPGSSCTNWQEALFQTMGYNSPVLRLESRRRGSFVHPLWSSSECTLWGGQPFSVDNYFKKNFDVFTCES